MIIKDVIYVFIGRDQELKQLNNLYNDNSFQFLVMYGRRRIGKTELLKEFSKNKDVLFFSALEKKSNLNDFSEEISKSYNENIDLSFKKWEDAFKYISNHTTSRKIIIIDEFPYIIKSEPIVKSILQHTIDHEWKDKNIMLILCGSSVSFMVDGVLSKKSPLYGRNTAVMEVLPFDYDMVSGFLPNYSNEDKMKVYGILGGVPYYLSKFSNQKTIEDNISDVIIENGASLREEPITLLKSELREPMTYNSILEAIANGANKITEIAEKSNIEVTKLPIYLKSLIEMRLVEKIVCCGEKKNTKKSQYIIKDNFFNFWYRFVFSKQTRIELMEAQNYAKSIKNEIDQYIGYRFEKICYQYLKKQAKSNQLPFIPNELGKWWGSNPITKTQDDIDILGIEKNNYLFCECKFKNEKYDLKELKDLITISSIFKQASNKYYYIFIKSSFTKTVIDESKKYNMKLITIDKMF